MREGSIQDFRFRGLNPKVGPSMVASVGDGKAGAGIIALKAL